jgi:hypothetical protein
MHLPQMGSWKSIEDAWVDYSSELPPDLPPEVRQHERNTFFAGGIAVTWMFMASLRCTHPGHAGTFLLRMVEEIRNFTPPEDAAQAEGERAPGKPS